jgi:hypothetical protein
VFQLLSIFHLDAFLSDSDFYWPGVLEGRFGKREKEEKEKDFLEEIWNSFWVIR